MYLLTVADIFIYHATIASLEDLVKSNMSLLAWQYNHTHISFKQYCQQMLAYKLNILSTSNKRLLLCVQSCIGTNSTDILKYYLVECLLYQ